MTIPTRERAASTVGTARGRHWILLAILLVALNLRIGITSLGALLDLVSRGTGLAPTAAAFATSLPVICFAAVGALGMQVTRRVGTHRGLTLAVVAITVGLTLRVLAGEGVLLVGTFLACSGIALANVLVPVLVKQHFPDHLGEVTGAYTAVMSTGAALGAALAVPVAASTGDWRGGLGLWSLVAVAALLMWLPLHRRPDATGVRTGDFGLLRDRLAWWVTLVFATQSLLAYVVMSWLPSIYADAGFDDRQSGLLLAGSILIGVPAYFVAPRLATRLRSQGHLIAGLTGLFATGMVGLLLAPTAGAWLWAALIGVGGSVFPVALALFGLRTRTASDTAALSTMAQSIGYLLAAAGPFAVGLMREASGSWALPIGLLLATCLVQVAAGYLAGRPLLVRPSRSE
ncbi:MAG TPA: MFS transporter [Nocardioides sp.]|uniref:MFS transporter n=1 Tax=Nocardioides sp. TaxID=35761 RepID=UPI002EDB1D5C